MSAIVASPEFILYKSGTNYKLFRSNLSDETAGVIDTQTSFDTLWSNFKTLIGNNPATVKVRDGVYDYSVTPTPTGSGFTIEGESKYNTIFRPQGNISAFSTNSLERIIIKNMRMLTEVGNTYTKKLLDVMSNGISRSYIHLESLVLDHFITSTRQQYGNALGFTLTGNNPALSWVTVRDITSNGFINTILCDTNTGSPTGNVWINDFTFDRVIGIHSFNFLKTDQLNTHDSFMWNFDHCGWQSTNVDGTSAHMFDIDDNAGARHFVWNISQCIMWDPANTNKKFLKANNNCRVNIRDSDPIDNRYMGGNGWDSTNMIWNSGARVVRNSYQNIVSGFSKQNGTGLKFDFDITPNKVNQDADKCRIFAIPVSDDCSTIPYSIRDGNRGTNTFTVRFGKPPRAGTNNVIIYWEVKEW